jgi:hypothetical protein
LCHGPSLLNIPIPFDDADTVYSTFGFNQPQDIIARAPSCESSNDDSGDENDGLADIPALVS